jgi:hypothetical protein
MGLEESIHLGAKTYCSRRHNDVSECLKSLLKWEEILIQVDLGASRRSPS